MLSREEGRAGSRMLAYDAMGRRIGRSGTWVRRLIGGEAVGVAYETFVRMHEAYLRHCAQVEADGQAAAERAARMVAQAEAIEARTGVDRR